MPGGASCRRHYSDYLHLIDGDGALLWEVPLTAALLNSRHAPLLGYAGDRCDPLHPNSVAVLPAAALSGLAAGDFLVSLRNVGALAALDGRDGRVKRIWRGSFYGQHGARVLPGPTGPAFLLFDNWGREGEWGPGRLLALDVRSGRERTVFPNASTPAMVALRSKARGGVSIAPDGSRAIVHSYLGGQAVEVDLASGETTAVFQSLDDVSAFAGATDEPGRAYRWKMRDLRYAAAGGRGVRVE